MPTGIEIAGLVLGAFPLAIEGIKAYSDGMKAVKDMKNYQQILRQFSRELGVEQCKFDNTCLGLLTEFVGPAKANRMKADLHSAEWDDEDFRRQLKAQLGPAEETLDNWLYVAEQLKEALCTVCKKFQLLPQEQKKKPTLMGGRSQRRKFDPRLAWTVGTLSEYRKEQIGIMSQRNDDLIKLANGGRKPSSDTGTSNSTTNSDSLLITYHQQVQHHAKFLYSMLREKLVPPMCKCRDSHGAHLELKIRSTPPAQALSKPRAPLHGPNHFFTFSLTFSTQHGQVGARWHEFQLEPVAGPKSQPRNIVLSPSSIAVAVVPAERGRSVAQSPSPPHMSDILGHRTFKSVFNRFSRALSPMQATHKPHPDESQPTTPTPINQPYAKKMKKNLKARFADGDTSSDNDDSGGVDDNANSFSNLPTIVCFCTTLATYNTIHRPETPPQCVGLLTSTNEDKHRVWTLLQQSFEPPRLVSLTDLITNYTNIRNKPSCESRLVLGLKLISSVLQLNTTQWLSEIWESKDIFFPDTGLQVTNIDHQHNILSRPFVHQSFSISGSTVVGDDCQQQRANQAKSVMGCNQSLYSLGIVLLEIWHWQTFSSLYNSLASRLSELEFSCHLSERLFHEAGDQYAMAVRRCIRGFEMRETDLENDLFRRKVYQDVLGLLLDNLRNFSRCNKIEKIIREE